MVVATQPTRDVPLGNPVLRTATDACGRTIDLTPISVLIGRIVATWRPDQIWLFGSRARGEAKPDSDWDLFVVVPDDVPDGEIGPVAAWRLRKEARTRADVVPCHAADYREARDTPNTLAYLVAREGVPLLER